MGWWRKENNAIPFASKCLKIYGFQSNPVIKRLLGYFQWAKKGLLMIFFKFYELDKNVQTWSKMNLAIYLKVIE